MILHPHPEGHVAILQSAHALMAFQLADHWGNRTTARPSPRADVLAAVMLHDAGWDGREEPPRLAGNGLPVAFDTVPEEEHEALWTDAVERAATRGRYAAYLVSHHVSHLAEQYSRSPHPDFLAGEERRRAALREELGREPAYAQVLAGPADAVNRAVMRIADAIAVHLSRGARGHVTISELPQRDRSVGLELHEVGERTYRLRPWPLTGARLVVHADGRLLPAFRWEREGELVATWREARTVRLAWTLLAPGSPAAD